MTSTGDERVTPRWGRFFSPAGLLLVSVSNAINSHNVR